MLLRLINRLLPKNYQKIYSGKPQKIKYLKINSFFKFCDMSPDSNLLKPPECVYELKTLTRELFNKNIDVGTLRIEDQNVAQILPKIKKYFLKLENFKPVITEDKTTTIYLNPGMIRKWSDFTSDEQEFLKQNSVTENDFITENKTLTYDNFSWDSIFKAVLPKNYEGLSSFTKTGHIVHVNLREHLLPYKHLIGQVLHDKVHGCKTVVNKIDMIDSTYRNFEMEVLKGDDNMITQVKENKCIFEFDFSKVYWNSRLCTEHERIVKMIKSGDIVFDVFAGVGPFSLPLAKKRCTVYANDLNPDSYLWLNQNQRVNKISDDYFKSYNKDGKDFILEEIRSLLPQYLINKKQVYIIMNLPAIAVNFLQNFVGLLKDRDNIPTEFPEPIVIVYCFVKGENYMLLTKCLLDEKIDFDISDNIVEIFRVRTVSSLKEMMRIVLKLDRNLLLGCNKRKGEDLSGDKSKKYHGQEAETTKAE